ncbi:hypothetical protein D9M71_763000 [compost metagenome]
MFFYEHHDTEAIIAKHIHYLIPVLVLINELPRWTESRLAISAAIETIRHDREAQSAFQTTDSIVALHHYKSHQLTPVVAFVLSENLDMSNYQFHQSWIRIRRRPLTYRR